MNSQQLLQQPIGTTHVSAKCCWCQTPLVVGQVLQLRTWLCPVDWRRQVSHALMVTAKGKEHAQLLGVASGTAVCLNVPLPSQAAFYECPARNVLWGGQAGPGKSHGARWWLYDRSLSTPGHQGLLLRENWEELEKHHLREMRNEVPKLGGVVVDRTARFPNGSYIDCGHMADADAVKRYLSSEYGAIVPDEASQYPVDFEGSSVLAELSTRARKVYLDVNGREVAPKFLPVSNPGGPSAGWLRDMFVDHLPDYEKFPALAEEDGYDPQAWVYMPAKLSENPYQMTDYGKTVLAVLSKTRYEQLARGDWHVFAGQFFQQWLESKHVADIDLDPKAVRWFRSLDWGYNQPGCVLWWAILPDGRLYIRDDWKFQQCDEPEVARVIKLNDQRLGIEQIAYTAVDPAIFSKTGATHRHGGFIGQSIADTLRHYGITCTPADNDRINGWKRCHALLREAPDNRPWLLVHPDARYLVRSMAGAKSDKANADDVDTKSDDHALDTLRYGAMTRPSPGTFADTPSVDPNSIAWLRSRFAPKPGLLSRYVA